VIVQIFLAELSTPNQIRPVKWKLRHPSPVASVIVNANTVQRRPTIFSVGAQPFLSVCSIPKTPDRPARSQSRLFGWLRSSDVISDVQLEWEIEDEGRVARSLAVNEEGRWLAVSDSQGRVTIIDCVFGHVTKIVKGMRDAQIAWAHLNSLLIYAPARGVILACTVPRGEIFAAVKVDKKGKLVQQMTADKELKVLFIDSHGLVAPIDVRQPPRPPDAEPPPSPCHFTAPLLPTED
jgi:hypothetical protein